MQPSLQTHAALEHWAAQASASVTPGARPHHPTLAHTVAQAVARAPFAPEALLVSVAGAPANWAPTAEAAEHLYPEVLHALLAMARDDQEPGAWRGLAQLSDLPIVLAKAHLRALADHDPYPERLRYDQWWAAGPKLAPLLRTDGRRLVALDLSRHAKSMHAPAAYATLDRFEQTVETLLRDAGADLGYGGYLEQRAFYTTEHFATPGNHGPRHRSLHLGFDVWGPAGETIYAPLAGRVHSFRQNTGQRDYGATIVLEHRVSLGAAGAPSPLAFYTLYGHLSAASLSAVRVGQRVAAGEAFAKTGEPSENGGWPPHVHFQVMLDLLGKRGDFPGVAFPEERAVWARLCPDAGAWLGLPADDVS